MNKTVDMDKPIVDFSSLKAFTGGDIELMSLHIDTFLEFAPAKLEALKRSLSEQNWSNLKNAAHKLKPMLSYMGVKSIVTIVYNIEILAEEERDLQKLPELLAQVEITMNQAIVELKKFKLNN